VGDHHHGRGLSTRAKRMALESSIFLASPHREANEMARKVSYLEGELAVTC
jgi:hypothetical protein